MSTARRNAIFKIESKTKTTTKGRPYSEDQWCLYSNEGVAVMCSSEKSKGGQRYGMTRESAIALARKHNIPGPDSFQDLRGAGAKATRIASGPPVVMAPGAEVTYNQAKGIGLALGGLNTYCPSALKASRAGGEKVSNAMALTAMGVNRGMASAIIDAMTKAGCYGVNLENKSAAAKAHAIMNSFGVSCPARNNRGSKKLQAVSNSGTKRKTRSPAMAREREASRAEARFYHETADLPDDDAEPSVWEEDYNHNDDTRGQDALDEWEAEKKADRKKWLGFSPPPVAQSLRMKQALRKRYRAALLAYARQLEGV